MVRREFARWDFYFFKEVRNKYFDCSSDRDLKDYVFLVWVVVVVYMKVMFCMSPFAINSNGKRSIRLSSNKDVYGGDIIILLCLCGKLNVRGNVINVAKEGVSARNCSQTTREQANTISINTIK